MSDFYLVHLRGDDWLFLRRRLPTVRTSHSSALLEARSATSLRRRLDKAVIFPLELLAARLATRAYVARIVEPSWCWSTMTCCRSRA